jgi:hypothetical protein
MEKPRKTRRKRKLRTPINVSVFTADTAADVENVEAQSVIITLPYGPSLILNMGERGLEIRRIGNHELVVAPKDSSTVIIYPRSPSLQLSTPATETSTVKQTG